MYMKGRCLLQIDSMLSQHQETKVSVVSMFADLRDFSSWLNQAEIENVVDLINGQYLQVLQVCCDCHVDFLKAMGDGFLLLWEADADVDAQHV